MKVKIDTRKNIIFLSWVALILIAINSIILMIYFYIGDPDTFGFVQMFDMDMERNIPTLFSSVLLLIAAYLFYLLSLNDSQRKQWLGLSVIFTFLAFDEASKIHESIGDYTEKFVEATGFLYYPWVISYGVMVLFLGLIYFKFFFAFERKVFFSFMLSAFIFLSGAIGIELLGANEASQHGSDTMLYCFLFTIEESLEMFGVIYLIAILQGLLKHKEIEII